MPTTENTTTRRDQLFARTSDETLLDSLALLDLATVKSPEERLAYAWTCDELTRRHPHTDALLDEAFADLDEARTYGQIITALLAR